GPVGSMPVVMEMTVTVSNMDYHVNGVQQGTIVLYRGFTYTFDLSSSTLNYHPFKIGTSSEGNEYTSGTSTTGSILSFTVPLDAPSSLYYYCDVHAGMGGSISILSLGSVS
ncbi:MAG: baseplate wedge protein, partial [Candidatus Thermoplasmatota archaeon]|nr:baseplate wedge protein [Candidatus Thermoplasmatota archaeon]